MKHWAHRSYGVQPEANNSVIPTKNAQRRAHNSFNIHKSKDNNSDFITVRVQKACTTLDWIFLVNWKSNSVEL